MMFLRIFKYTCIVLITQCLIVNGKSRLNDLNETTWTEMLNGEWFVQFYAPWCPACKQLAPIWEEFSEWGEDLGIQVGQVDVTSNPGLSGRFMITALPTVYHAKDGTFRLYTGARDKDALFSFIEEKKWTKIDPVSSWGSPQSISMSTVSYFFQLSMTLRDMHNWLTGEMGFHAWTAHAWFGIVTIITGVILGLLVVAVIDCIYSVRRWLAGSSYEKNMDDSQENGENNGVPPLTDESIDDDLEEVPAKESDDGGVTLKGKNETNDMKRNASENEKEDNNTEDEAASSSSEEKNENKIKNSGIDGAGDKETTGPDSPKIVHRKVNRPLDASGDKA